MSKLSKDKKEQIMSHITSILYEHFPEPLFTAQISRLQARDEEFVKALMLELEKRGIVKAIRKNPKGTHYIRRVRWTLTPKAHDAYSNL